MKRWRTDSFARRLSLLRQRSRFSFWRSPPDDRVRPARNRRPPFRQAFSRANLERVGDYIRNEIATGNIPGAILLIQQHGQPVYFESFGVRDVANQACR